MYNSSFLDNLSDKENNQPNEQNNNSKINLDDIILALEFAIDDINKEENKFYIIQEIENVIMKLKKLSKNLSSENGVNLQQSKKILLRPPSSGVTTIELTKNLKAKYNYSPLRPQRKNSQDFSTNSCVSNISRRISARVRESANRNFEKLPCSSITIWSNCLTVRPIIFSRCSFASLTLS